MKTPPSGDRIGRLRILVAFNCDHATMEMTEEDADPLPSSKAADEEVVESAELAGQALASMGHRVTFVALDADTKPLQAAIRKHDPDVVVNLVESLGSDPSREPEVPELLDELGIAYTGNSGPSLRAAGRKDVCRRLLGRRGVRIPAGCVVEPHQDPIPLLRSLNLTFPLFVKPVHSDGSIGISQQSYVTSMDQLVSRVQQVRRLGDGRALVESYLPGAEINVAALGLGVGLTAVSTIDFSAVGPDFMPFVTYDAKWTSDSPECRTQSVSPEGRLAPHIVAAAIEQARLSLAAVGATSYGRVDLRLDAQGRPNVVDVNPNPDLHPEAGFCLSFGFRGIDHAEIWSMLVQAACGVRADKPRKVAKVAAHQVVAVPADLQ